MMTAHQHPSLSLSTLRHFTSTAIPRARSAAPDLLHRHASIPPYPFPPSAWYKQSNFGLYGHTRIRFGNRVSSITETKTRHAWHPNIRRQRLWSEALDRFVRVKVHSRILRTIDKCGGLDEYLLGDRVGRIRELGMGGWALRWRVMRTERVRERFRVERERLGLGVGVRERERDGGLGQGQGVVGSNRDAMEEEEAREVEGRIDRALDEDERRERKGEDGGVELGAEFGEEGKGKKSPGEAKAKEGAIA